MISIILGEYLRSLKEREELDRILPLLLDQMGFEIIKTATSSRGQSEYGVDMVATKVEDGVKKKFVFQIKAGQDGDITSNVFTKTNGIRDSLLQIKDYDYKDISIRGFNKLKTKIILVHNGEIQFNFKPVFEGFLEKEFLKKGKKGVEFERWDIFKLTEYFSKYLFNEYLLVKQEYISLLKKALSFLDVLENDNRHFKKLVDNILNDQKKYNYKTFKKLILLLCIISEMIFHYSKEINNLEPAKDCLTYLLLKTWGWILEKKVEKNNKLVEEFVRLSLVHYRLLNEYFTKTLDIAKETDGLFSEKGGDFEIIGYPMRCFEYIGYLIYFYQIDELIAIVRKENYNNQKKLSIEYLKNIILNNSGCSRPLLDNHSISIVLVLKFLIENNENKTAEVYLKKIFNNLSIIKYISKRLPELYDNTDALIECVTSKKKPSNYVDDSSYLLNILFEFIAILNDKDSYNEFLEFLAKDSDLISFFPPEDIVDKEHLLFQQKLNEGSTLSNPIIKKDDLINNKTINFETYKEELKKLNLSVINYRSDSVFHRHLRYLAHIYFKTLIFPNEWRFYLKK
jgi:hypothetical protein